MKLSEEEKLAITASCIEACTEGEPSICVFLARELSLKDLKDLHRTNIYQEMRSYARRVGMSAIDGVSWFGSQEERISFIIRFDRYLQYKQQLVPYTAADAAMFLGKLITHIKPGSIYGAQGIVTSCTPTGYIMAGGHYITLDRAFREIEYINGTVFGRIPAK